MNRAYLPIIPPTYLRSVPMYGDTVREGRIIAVVAAQIHRTVWACVDPVLCQFASLDVPPQTHEGMTLRIIGPAGFLRGLLAF